MDFEGDPDKAMELARAALTQAGYRIIDNSERTVSVIHQGGFGGSRSGGPLFGTSPVTVSVSGGRIAVQARFEGVEKAKRFILRLLGAMALVLGAGLGITFGLVFPQKWPMYLGLGLGVGIPLIQLPIHLMVTPRIIRRRASRALDTLMHNMSMVG